MKNSKKKIILMLILFLGLINIANSARADDIKFIRTKETDSVIEGVIESTNIQKEHMYAENNLATTTSSINPKTFFYDQLKNSLSKKVYNSLKKDTTGIGLTELNINEVYSVNATKFINSETYRQNIFNSQISGYFDDAIAAFNDDNPKIYWYYEAAYNVYYSLNKEKNQITYTSLKIESKFEEKKNYIQFNKKLKEVADSINGTSTYEIAKKCHDYICNTVTYTRDDTTNIDQTAYDALINQKGVCDAEARLFQLLCTEKGVNCILVSGNAGGINDEKEAHAWNYVYHPEEKKWYAVDVTWDNNKKYGKPTTYNYFLVGTNTGIKYSNGTCLFSEDHIPGFKYYEVQTFTPAFPELSENAYEKFSGKMKRSTTSKTNEPVTVTATFNRELQDIPSDWTLSEDRKKITKTFEDNEIVQDTVVNIRGERLKINFNISNIDKIAPIATVSYSNTDKKAQSIVVKISGNEELQSINGWALSSDKKELTKTYNNNKAEDIEISDIAGNKKTIHIEVKNIDKIKPMLVTAYDLSEITKGKVLVTLESNEELQELEGWEISENKKVLSKIYTENNSEQVQIKDLAGNISKKRISVNNIGNTSQNFITQYIIYDRNIGVSEVNIISNRPLKPKDNWTLSENLTIMSKTYTEDLTEVVKVEDINGNEEELSINIENYTEPLITEVSYSKTERTNEDVKVTILSNKQVQEVNGWEISEDQKSLTKVYTENTTETVILKDYMGNQNEEAIEIKNIDKVQLELNVQYSDVNKNGEVMVTITSNKELMPKENWTLSEDKKTLSRSYNSTVQDDILVQDLSGYQKEVSIDVTEEQLKPIEEIKKEGGLKTGNSEWTYSENQTINQHNNNNNQTNQNNSNVNNNPTEQNNTKITNNQYNSNSYMNEDNIDSAIEVENSNIDNIQNNQNEIVEKQKYETKKTKNQKMALPYTGYYFKQTFLIIVYLGIGFISYYGYRKYKGIDK